MFETQRLVVILGEYTWVDCGMPPSIHDRQFVTASGPTWRRMHTILHALCTVTVTELLLAVM
jgi:hypothetical protein